MFSDQISVEMWTHEILISFSISCTIYFWSFYFIFAFLTLWVILNFTISNRTILLHENVLQKTLNLICFSLIYFLDWLLFKMFYIFFNIWSKLSIMYFITIALSIFMTRNILLLRKNMLTLGTALLYI